jgi:hypothetical protein
VTGNPALIAAAVRKLTENPYHLCCYIVSGRFDGLANPIFEPRPLCFWWERNSHWREGMKVVLAYKNFAASKNISHIGLGVAALNTSKSLIREGIPAQVWPIVNSAQLVSELRKRTDVSHVVVSAPWIPSQEIQSMIVEFPDVSFAVSCHSNVGFLQADSNGVKLVREAMEIERASHNFHLAGNSRKFSDWVQRAYSVPCAHLPNLYYLDEHANPHRPLFSGGVLRIGAFGATRPLKNFMSACGAALEVAQQLKVETEVWLSAGRAEGGGEVVLRAAREMMRNLPHIRLVENGWQTWPQFRTTVAHMHLLLQPSYTESFNMVTRGWSGRRCSVRCLRRNRLGASRLDRAHGRCRRHSPGRPHAVERSSSRF